MKALRFCFVSLFLTGALCGNAQGILRWTDGPLTWERFQRVDSTQTDPYKATFSFSKENKKVKIDGILYKYMDVSAALDTGQCWVQTGKDTDENLQRLQKEFDLLQYFAERYRTDYLFHSSPELTNQHDAYFGTDKKHHLPEVVYIDGYRAALEACKNGKSYEDYHVSREPFDISKVPCQIEKGSSDAIISLVDVIPTGELANHFGPAVGFRAGYGHREGKSLFSAELTVGHTGLDLSNFNPFRVSAIGVQGAHIGLMARYCGRLFPIKEGGVYLSGGAGYSCWKHGDIMAHVAFGGITLSQGVDIIVPLQKTMNFVARKPQLRDMSLHFRLSVDEMYAAPQKLLAPTISLSAGLDFGYRNITKALPQK